MGKECYFRCVFIDAAGECDEMGSECIGDMCENWEDCEACLTDRDECQE